MYVYIYICTFVVIKDASLFSAVAESKACCIHSLGDRGGKHQWIFPNVRMFVWCKSKENGDPTIV